MLAPLLSILVFGCMNLAAFAVGAGVLRVLHIEASDRLTAAVWSIATGFIVVGLVLAAMGLVGVLYPSAIGVLTLAAGLVGLGALVRSEPMSTSKPPQEPTVPNPCPPPARFLVYGLLVLAGVAATGALVTAMAPPVASEALSSSLELPKRFLAEHRLVTLPYHDRSSGPLLTELWYLWALALDSEVCAQLVHWEMGLLLAAASVLLATPLLGRPWAWVAGALVLLVPGVNHQMTSALDGVALAAMTTLALTAWWQAAINDEHPRWFVLAGLAAGAALSTQYAAVLFLGAAVPAWSWVALRWPERRVALGQGLVIVAVVALVVAGIWYVRTAGHRRLHVAVALQEQAEGDRGDVPRRGPLQLVLSPWNVTMFPERFGTYGDRLGVVLLASLPGLLVSRRLRGLDVLLAMTAGYWILWFLTGHDLCSLYPLVPWAACGVVWAWVEMRRWPAVPRTLTATTLALLLSATAQDALVRCRHDWAVAFGVESRSHYLLRTEPTYSTALVANLLVPPDAHILSEDQRTFYFSQAITPESSYRRLTRYDQQLVAPGQLSRQLRGAGFSHIFLAQPVTGPQAAEESMLERLVAEQLRTKPESLPTLSDYRFADADGTVRRYRLIGLR